MRATDLRDRGILYEYPPKTKERKDRRLANEWTVWIVAKRMHTRRIGPQSFHPNVNCFENKFILRIVREYNSD